MKNYLEKHNPSVEDWLNHNQALFMKLRGEETDQPVNLYGPLSDIDIHARRANLTVEQLFQQIQEQAGDLGAAALQLVYSKMDDAYHIVVGPGEADTDDY